MLEGLKIVEMATYIAAPGAGGIMADWGADVVVKHPAELRTILDPALCGC